LGGHVDMFFPSTPSILQFVESKKIRALAVSSIKRTTALPDIKTVAEEGIKDFSFTLWGGVYAPTGTSEEILNYLNTNINIILEDPSFKKNLEKDGILVRRNSRIEFGDFMKSEFTKYAKIVKAIDLKVE
ncbi:MAG: tripartite tricarboxylate transporter substrate binding protein, partial [Polynucleobacter sp.]|nr:tripartite tricarboxylate transporter substrate binding protein [Polynucleobacter sp.]